MAKLAEVSIDQIRANPIALREVTADAVGFKEMCDSVKANGILMPILVRERVDESDGSMFYQVIDGLHRYTAAKTVRLTTMPVSIADMTDEGVEIAQIIANLHKVETKPSEYTEGLKRLLARDPMMTIADLASQMCRSPKWIEDRLSLQRIKSKPIQDAVNAGEICLTNAVALSRLPVEEHDNYVEQAMTMQPKDFGPLMANKLKEIRSSTRTGQQQRAEWAPHAHLQKLSTLKNAIDPELDDQCVKILNDNADVTDRLEVFRLAIKWALHLDPASIAEAKAKYEKDEADRKAANEARKAERKQLESERQAKRAAEVKSETEKAKAALANAQ